MYSDDVGCDVKYTHTCITFRRENERERREKRRDELGCARVKTLHLKVESVIML